MHSPVDASSAIDRARCVDVLSWFLIHTTRAYKVARHGLSVVVLNDDFRGA